MTEETKLVTLETKSGVTTPADEEIARAAETGEGVAVSPEQLMELAKQGAEKYDAWTDEFGRMMTPTRAAQVRRWRVDWRAVAQAAYDAGWPGDWYPSSNQIAGMALCRVAAERTSEDYMEPPWN